MNVLDWFILAVLGLGVWRGFSNGFIREVARILALVVAFVLGTQLMRPVGLFLSVSMGISEALSPVIGFVVVFIAVLALVFSIARMLEFVAGSLFLGPVNRVLGAMFGGIKATLVLSLLFLVSAFFGFPGEQTRSESQLYMPVTSFVTTGWEAVAEAWPEVRNVSDRFSIPVESTE